MDNKVRSTMSCSNFLDPNFCDRRVIQIFYPTAKKTGGSVDLLNPDDYNEADSICRECRNFKPKSKKFD